MKKTLQDEIYFHFDHMVKLKKYGYNRSAYRRASMCIALINLYMKLYGLYPNMEFMKTAIDIINEYEEDE